MKIVTTSSVKRGRTKTNEVSIRYENNRIQESICLQNETLSNGITGFTKVH